MREITPGTVRAKLKPNAERLIDGLGIDWVESSSFYARTGQQWPTQFSGAYENVRDFIVVSERTRDCNATFLHEVIHWTGQKGRLNRRGIVEHPVFGSPAYNIEEGIAELGGYYLAEVLGIATYSHRKRMLAYLTAHGVSPNLVEEPALQAVSYVMEIINNMSIEGAQAA